MPCQQITFEIIFLFSILFPFISFQPPGFFSFSHYLETLNHCHCLNSKWNGKNIMQFRGEGGRGTSCRYPPKKDVNLVTFLWNEDILCFRLLHQYVVQKERDNRVDILYLSIFLIFIFILNPISKCRSMLWFKVSWHIFFPLEQKKRKPQKGVFL